MTKDFFVYWIKPKPEEMTIQTKKILTLLASTLKPLGTQDSVPLPRKSSLQKQSGLCSSVMHSEKGTVHLIFQPSVRQIEKNILLTGWSLLFRKDFDSVTYHPLASGTELKFNVSWKMATVIKLTCLLSSHCVSFSQDITPFLTKTKVIWSSKEPPPPSGPIRAVIRSPTLNVGL